MLFAAMALSMSTVIGMETQRNTVTINNLSLKSAITIQPRIKNKLKTHSLLLEEEQLKYSVQPWPKDHVPLLIPVPENVTWAIIADIQKRRQD